MHEQIKIFGQTMDVRYSRNGSMILGRQDNDRRVCTAAIWDLAANGG